jgi:homopolymeric O-antigen transport system permease protein
MLRTSTFSEDTPQRFSDDLREIAHDMRRSKNLIFQLTLRDIRIRYKQAVLGFAWAILTPLLVVTAGLIVRAAFLHMAGRPLDVDSAMGIVVKASAWAFVSGAIGFSTTALTANVNLLSKTYFPRETMPLSIVLASAFDWMIGTAAVAVFLPLAGWRPSISILWVPVLMVVLFVLTLAVALVVSCANLFYRDVKYIVQLLITYGIFFTPVFYEPNFLGAQWVPIQMLNPIAPILEGLRLSVIVGHNLFVTLEGASDGSLIWTPWYLAGSMVWAFGGLLVSAVIFHRAQYRFAEKV